VIFLGIVISFFEEYLISSCPILARFIYLIYGISLEQMYHYSVLNIKFFGGRNIKQNLWLGILAFNPRHIIGPHLFRMNIRHKGKGRHQPIKLK
jgi:hypothetical protein